MGQKYKNDGIRTAINDNCLLNGYVDKVPDEIEDKIILNVDVTPNKNKIIDTIFNGSGTFTLDSTKQFYIDCIYASSGAILGIGASSSVIAMLNGVITYMAEVVTVGDGASSNMCLNQFFDFSNNPIKLDIGSNIVQISGGGTVITYGHYVDKNIYEGNLKIL